MSDRQQAYSPEPRVQPAPDEAQKAGRTLLVAILFAAALGAAAVPMQIIQARNSDAAQNRSLQANQTLLEQLTAIEKEIRADATAHEGRSETLHACILNLILQIVNTPANQYGKKPFVNTCPALSTHPGGAP